mmetsp:Transcript_5254/g.15420  ORF Transcript_5254/g.15420 Transcript_5254/m.15420 type:complete len:159 (-) Transcript_5254:133-609(-)
MQDPVLHSPRRRARCHAKGPLPPGPPQALARLARRLQGPARRRVPPEPPGLTVAAGLMKDAICSQATFCLPVAELELRPPLRRQGERCRVAHKPQAGQLRVHRRSRRKPAKTEELKQSPAGLASLRPSAAPSPRSAGLHPSTAQPPAGTRTSPPSPAK